MKINTLTLLIVLSLLISGCSSGKGKITTSKNKSGEIIVRVEKNPDRTKTRIFSRGDKKIAKQTEDKDGALIATEGIIPDGMIRAALACDERVSGHFDRGTRWVTG